MKRMGAILLLLGLVIIGTSYAGYPLSVVSTQQQNYVIGIPSAATVPSSMNSANPTIFAHNGYQVLSITWTGTVPLQYIDLSGTGKASVAITELTGQNTVTVEKSMQSNWTLSYWVNPLTHKGVETYTATATYNFTNPLPNYNVIWQFQFSGSSSWYNGWNNSYIIFKYYVATTYGEFPLQSIQGLGNFYLQVGNTTPVKIVSGATSLYYNTTGYSIPFQVWYVEDNGVTTPFTDAYITYRYTQGGTVNNTIYLNIQTTFNSSINGSRLPIFPYHAYTSTPTTVPTPTTLVIEGYVSANGVINSPSELMNVALNIAHTTIYNTTITTTNTTTYREVSGSPPPTTSFSMQQYISFGIGAVLILIGAVWIFKR
jgi:hypothetical protein